MKFNEVAHEVTAKPGLEEHFGLTPTSLHSLKKTVASSIACENSRFSSLFAAGDISRATSSRIMSA